MSDLTVSLKIDLSKFTGGLEEVKAKLLGVEGTHEVKIETNPKKSIEGIAQIGMALTGLQSAISLIRNAWNSTVGDWIQSAQESDKANKLVEQGIIATGGAAKVSAEDISTWADELMRVTNFDDDEIKRKVSSIFLTFRNIGGPTFKEAQVLALDLSTVLNQDLQSSAIMLGKALNEPVQGITALRRVGIQLTDQQEEQVKAFMAVNDIASAQRVILDEVANQVGGQASATADSLTQMNNAMGEVSEQIGGILLPYIREFASYVKDSVIPVIQSTIEFFNKFGSTIMWVSGTAIAGFVAQALWAAKASFTLSGAMVALNSSIIANPIVLISGAIGFLISQIVRAKERVEEWTDVLWVFAFGMTRISLTVWNFARALITTGVAVLAHFISPILEGFSAVTDSFSLLLKGDFKGAGDRITKGLADGVKNGFVAIRTVFKENWENVANDPKYDTLAKALYEKVKLSPEQRKDLLNNSPGGVITSPEGEEKIKEAEKIIHDFSDIQLEIRKDTAQKEEEIDLSSVDQLTEMLQKKRDILQEFNQADYEMNRTYSQMKRDEIDEYYEHNKAILLEMGKTEAEIDEQRRSRLLETYDLFQGISSSVGDGVREMYDGIIDKSLSTQERWENVWKAMSRSAFNAIGRIIQKTAEMAFQSIFLKKAEGTVHEQVETQKTGVTLTGVAARGAAAIAGFAKETALAIGAGIKFVAVKVWEIATAMVKFFSFLGPFAPAAAAASMAGVVAMVNSFRKGFKSGGYTGDGDPNDEAGVVHRGEYVFPANIVRGNVAYFDSIKNSLQGGFTTPNLSSTGAGVAAMQNSRVIGLLEALNQNLVNKNMNVNVSVDKKGSVRQDSIAREKAMNRGERLV